MAPVRKRGTMNRRTALRLAGWGMAWALPASVPVGAASPTLSFVEAPGSPLATPGVTDNFVLADVTGDGVLDIVVTGQPLQTYIGNGDGTFRPPVASTVASNGAASVGDFNGDGLQDLAVRFQNTLTIALSNGDGTFRQAPDSPRVYPNGIGLITVADLNGDGILDLVGVGEAPANTPALSLGNGDGTFRTILAPPAPDAELYDPVFVHDVTGDGIPDLIYGVYATNGGGGQDGVRVLVGNGDGSFHVGSFTPVPLSQAVATVSGRIRRGDTLDVALNRGTVLHSNGDGTFTTVVAGNNSPVGGAWGDFNADGLLEFAFIADSRNNHIYTYVNRGDGTYAVAYEFPPSNVSVVQAGDVNGDGRADLVSFMIGPQGIHVYLSTSPYPASRIAPQPAPHAAASVAATTPAPAPTLHPPFATPTPLPQPPPRTTTGSARSAGTVTTTAAPPQPMPPPAAAATPTPLPAPRRH